MDLPSPSGPRETSPARTVLLGLLTAIGSLVAGAAAMWALFTLIRFLIHFVQSNWPWLVALVVFATVLLVTGKAASAYARYEAEQREEQLRALARFERVDVMSGGEFEDFVAELLRRDGYLAVEVIGRNGDRGVDITARTCDGRKLAIQCKRNARTIPADRVRNLIGAVHSSYTGYQGVLVTNNEYSAQAQDEGHGRIVMIGRDELGDWMAGLKLAL